ncbi:hypothetical protein T10_11615 [Trichinella papuae]|uniref:Uncharacterized protein n=1 Tax=Trichinella papuae TaxID=268474 RepID=A0A0V1LW66_9BILA|nr:hypothetical protein T10_11615 [Trichinella papuae]
MFFEFIFGFQLYLNLAYENAPLHDIFLNCFKYSLKSAGNVMERC